MYARHELEYTRYTMNTAARNVKLSTPVSARPPIDTQH